MPIEALPRRAPRKRRLIPSQAHKAGVDHRAAPAPRRLDGASESSSDDEAVEFIGGSRQVKSQKGKGDSDYYYAHRPENYVTKVDMAPEKLSG